VVKVFWGSEFKFVWEGMALLRVVQIEFDYCIIEEFMVVANPFGVIIAQENIIIIIMA
jgi:hypothetical protein